MIDGMSQIFSPLWWLLYWSLNKQGYSLKWRHNEHDGVSNHQPHDCLLNRLFRCRSKKASKLHITGLCEGNSPVTGEFPTQMASKVENVSICWDQHVIGDNISNWKTNKHFPHKMPVMCNLFHCHDVIETEGLDKNIVLFISLQGLILSSKIIYNAVHLWCDQYF